MGTTNAVSAKAADMAPFESFEEYTAQRVMPPAFRIARASAVVYVVLACLEYGASPNQGLFVSTIPYRVFALAALALMAFALGSRWFGLNRVAWTMVFGLLSEAAMVYWNLFILHRPTIVIFIVMFFLFGILTVAPAITMPVYAGAALATAGHITLQLILSQAPVEAMLQIGLFLVPALLFLGHAVFTQRQAAREFWGLAAENHRLATIDSLSQVLNRGTWYRQSAAWLAKLGADAKVSFLMLDIDHFKAVNDTWGHESGDSVIRSVAAAIVAEVRCGDLVGRLGGEEFGVLLPGADAAQAQAVAERVRQGVEALQISLDGRRITVTASLGCCTAASTGLSLDQIIRQGDECLYRAKHGGRNRVVSAGGDELR